MIGHRLVEVGAPFLYNHNMGILQEITKGYERGIARAEATESRSFSVLERHSYSSGEPENAICLGDNLEYMKWLIENGFEGKIKCIYIDPPFFTKAKYNAVVDLKDAEGAKHKVRILAYDDRFERDLVHYIENVAARLIMIKRLLAKDGLLWVHLDWHSAHYVRILLDEIFGQKNFINEIIWKYKSGGSAKRHFSRKHDTILVYAGGAGYRISIPEEKSYNRGLKPYNFKGVKEYRDEYGWYTMVNMKDVWAIDMVGRTSRERTGYATQKPFELMRRIIEASTEPGDLCADFFCGSGSFLCAADNLGRRWLGCDSEELAVSISKRRLDSETASYNCFAPEGADIYRRGLSVKLIKSEELENGKKLLFYCVDGFEPEIDFGHIPFGDREAVEMICRRDPLCLLDCIMVDPDAGDVFSAEMTVSDGFDSIGFISRGKASFVAVDKFGKEYYSDGC